MFQLVEDSITLADRRKKLQIWLLYYFYGEFLSACHFCASINCRMMTLSELLSDVEEGLKLFFHFQISQRLQIIQCGDSLFLWPCF